MTSTATSIHVPPPQPLTTGSNPVDVVPLIQFASPYLAQQFTENATLHSQVNFSYSLTKEVEILILRLQDRIAHCILAVDNDNDYNYGGKNSEWSRRSGSKNGLLSFDDHNNKARLQQVNDIADGDGDGDAADATADATTSNSAIIDGWCRSSLGITFPRWGTHLMKYAQKEQSKAFEQLILLEETKREQLTDFTQIGLTLGIETVERWMNDFQYGLKLTGESESSSSSSHDSKTSCRVKENSMETDNSNSANTDHGKSCIRLSNLTNHTPSQQRYALISKVSLAAFVEYLTAEIFELSCNNARNYRHSVISGFDLWRAISNDDEFLHMIYWLAIDWHVTNEEIEKINLSADITTATAQSQSQSQSQSNSSAVAAAAATSSTSVSLGLTQLSALDDGLIAVLESEWKEELMKVQLQAESTPCWFSEPCQVHLVARRFARGELHDSAVSLSIIKYRCRPYRYWGHHVRSIFRDPASSYDSISPGGYEYVSFLLEDGAGQEWHLMIEYDMSQPESESGGSSIFTSPTPTITGGRFLLLECRWDFGRFSRLSEFISESKITITKVKFYSNYSNSNMSVDEKPRDPWPVTLITDKRYVPFVIEELTMSREARRMQQRIMDEVRQWHQMLLAEGCGYQIMSAGLQRVEQKEENKQQEQEGEEEEEKKQQGAAASSSVITAGSTAAAATTLPTASIIATSSEIEYEQHFKSRCMKLLQIIDCAQSDHQHQHQLYLANQPQKVRHTFTIALIDESMIACDDMTPLPTVLVALIADYHTLDLPYLDESQRKEIQSSTQSLTQPQQTQHQSSPFTSRSVASSSSSDERPSKRQKLESATLPTTSFA